MYTLSSPLIPLFVAVFLGAVFTVRYSVLSGKARRRWVREALIAWSICLLSFIAALQWIIR